MTSLILQPLRILAEEVVGAGHEVENSCELVVGEPREGVGEPGLERLEQGRQGGEALGGRGDEDTAAVVGVAGPADVAARLQPVDERGDGRGRETDAVGEVARGVGTLAEEDVEGLVIGRSEPGALGDGGVEEDGRRAVLAARLGDGAEEVLTGGGVGSHITSIRRNKRNGASKDTADLPMPS